MSNLYREQLLDLYENPLNYGELDPHSFSYQEDNPLCGDEVRIDVMLGEDGRIADIKWSGDGCAVSQAAASLLTEEAKGMTLDEVKPIDKQTLLDLVGMPLTMMRVKCALLSLKVLKAGAYGIPDPAEMRKHTLD